MPTVTSAGQIYVTSGGSAYNIASGRTLIKQGNTLYEISGSGVDVSFVTAQSGDVLSGKIFCDSAGNSANGGIQIQQSQTIIPTTSNQVISSGLYLNGDQIIVGDSNLVNSNIALGISIFGVSGTHQGGIDTSDANATENDLLEGKSAFVNGSKISGAIPILASSSYTPTTSNQTIPSGQYLGGVQTIVGDANLVSSNILSGVSIFGVSGTLEISGGGDVTLGYVSGGVFYELAFSGTSSIEVASSSGLSAYGWLLPVSAGDSGVVIYQPQSNYIYSSAQYMNNKSIYAPFEMHVYSGGTANSTTIETGGSMFVYSGGTANSTWVKNEYLTVYHGGVIKSTSLSGGKSIVLSGGTANYTSIYADFTVLSGGTANYTKIYGTRGSGHLTVGSGGSANYTSVGGDSGHLTVLSGGYAYSVTLDSVASAEMTISYGGSASEILIGSKTTLNISAGGTASFVTVSSGGSLMVYGSALAVNRLGPADIYSAPGAYIEYVSSGNSN